MLAHMMKCRSVSKSFPLPTIPGHHSAGSLFAVSAWNIHMTLSLASFSDP
jgi:hypothetical protein